MVSPYASSGYPGWAAGGMIAHCDPHLPDSLRPLAFASAAMYHEFAHELQDESGESPDLRDQGTLAFFGEDERPGCDGAREMTADETAELEPAMALQLSSSARQPHILIPAGKGTYSKIG